MEWSTVWMIVTTGLTLVLALVAIWLKNDRDLNKVKEYIARMIGDALAMAVDAAGNLAGSLTDEELDAISGGVYDFLVPRLPDGLPGLVLSLYPKASFQVLFRRVWREFLARDQAMSTSIARQ